MFCKLVIFDMSVNENDILEFYMKAFILNRALMDLINKLVQLSRITIFVKCIFPVSD